MSDVLETNKEITSLESTEDSMKAKVILAQDLAWELRAYGALLDRAEGDGYDTEDLIGLGIRLKRISNHVDDLGECIDRMSFEK